MKTRSLLRFLGSVLVLTLVLALFGCASEKKKDSKDAAAAGTEASAEKSADGNGPKFELYADSDSSKAGDLRTVYFPYDSDVITPDAESVLKGNIGFLNQFGTLKIQIEGHCDERGSVQYNLALGERRAKSVKNYLVASGVNADRITLISLGKEKPVDLGHNEDSWSKNRRGNFVIVEK
ncbi:MAG: peptidoglycan-associated lipoprotein Pal [Oligoflexia bacterium]|nr:peptidoglycan-associated lipoprotein Pal [Oligoflexia bacterium]